MTEDFPDSNEQGQAHLDAIRELSAEIPEIVQDQELIEKIAIGLVETYGINPEFFKDKTKTLLFAALAQRMGDVRHRQNHSGERRLQEEAFINNALILLLQKDSSRYPDYEDKIDKTNIGRSNEQLLRAFDRFTNLQMSAEMQQAIDEGLLDGVKATLGTLEVEEPYEIRVMSIGTDSQTYGMRPPMTSEMEADWQDPGWDDQALFDRYVSDLKVRSQDFEAAINEEIGENFLAWLTQIDDRKLLCLPQPMAEKILYTDQPRSNYYTVEDLERESTVLKHEYIHTQNSLPVNEVFFGMAMEEVRAEHFSGNRQGYQDAKGFFADLRTLTGVSITELFEVHRGVPKEELYVDLANQLGLQTLLELSLVVPDAYITDDRPLQKQINVQLGGFDGVLKNVYHRQINSGHQGAMQTRINQLATYLRSDNTMFANFIYGRRGYGVNFLPELYIKSAGYDPTLEQPTGEVTQQ